MSVEEQLRSLFEQAAAYGPSAAAAYQHYLRPRRRRAMLVRAAAGVGFVALLAAAVVISAVLPQRAAPIAVQPATVAPPGPPQGRYLPGPRRAATGVQGFELDVPTGPSNRRPDRPLTVELLDSRLSACRLRAALQVVVRDDAGQPLVVSGGQRPLVVEGDLPEGSADPTGVYRIT